MATKSTDLALPAQKGRLRGKGNGHAALRWVSRAGALVMVAVTAAGCSSLGVGESKFSCPGYPDGVQCMSTRDVYAATNDGDVPNAMGEDKAGQEMSDKQVQGLPSSQLGRSGIDPTRDPVGAYVAPALPDKPVPVRTPAQVMRIWVAPWEDTNGDLNVSGYLYTEIEPRRWTLGDPAPSSNPVLSPLSVGGVRNKDQQPTHQLQYEQSMQGAEYAQDSQESGSDDHPQPEN